MAPQIEQKQFILPGLGVGAGLLFLQFAAHDAGFTGHGASWPGYTKHRVSPADPDPDRIIP